MVVVNKWMVNNMGHKGTHSTGEHIAKEKSPQKGRGFCSHGHTAVTAASGHGRRVHPKVSSPGRWIKHLISVASLLLTHWAALGKAFPSLTVWGPQHHQLHVIPSLSVLLLFKFSLETGTCLVFKCQRQLPNSPEIMINGQCLFNISLVTGLRLAPPLLFLF